MKKTNPFGEWIYFSLKKTLLIMRFVPIFLILGILQVSALDVYGQKLRISLDFANTELIKVLDKIEEESDFYFLYNEKYLDTKRLVSISAKDQLISEILNDLLDGTDIKFSIVDRKIILAPEFITKNPEANTNIQQQIVTGKITDNKTNEGMPGVNIVVKGTSTGVISGVDGTYSISIQDFNATLVFSFIGYVKQEVPLEGRKVVNISLYSEVTGLDEVVVIGYGTQKVRELTGAVSQVKAQTLENIGASSFTQGLQGQVAGINVMASSGAPGSTANIQIRGIGSFSEGAINPLYVVDGIPVDGTPNFSANEIESVEVLKDAASASIYGTRASNGVILVTTKRGKSGEMKVGFDSYYGITKILRNMPLINNTVDWLYVNRVRYLAVKDYNGWTALVDNPRGLYNNTNWTDLFQVDNAPIQNYSLRLSGGSKDLTYSLVTSYFSQDGLWVNSAYKRLSTRANTHFVRGKFSSNVNLALSYDTRINHNSSLPSAAIRLRPFKAPLNYLDYRMPAPGSNAAAIQNIATMLKEVNQDRGNNASISMDLNYELFKGFILRANMGGSANNNYNKVFNPSFVLYDEYTGAATSSSFPIARLNTGQDLNQHVIGEFMGTYEKSFGKHNITAFAAVSMEQSTRESFNSGKRNFLSNDIQVLSGGAEDPTASGTKYVSSLVGSIGRVQYNFADRYMLSASVRRDGSSRFGDKYKFGVFPSVSIGWNIDEESFFKNSGISSVLTNAKIRASYGTTGNQFISDYLYSALITSGIDYVLGESDQALALGVIQTSFSNANIKWETSVSKDIGLDLRFFKGKLAFTGDVYITNKSDMLFPVLIPPSAGTGSSGTVIMNVGDMINKGYELSSTYRNSGSDFNFSLTAIFMKNVNEVTETNLASSTIWGGSGGTDPMTVIREGFPVGSFFLIPTDGLITTTEALTEYKLMVKNANLGDLKYVDVDGNGLIDDNDRVYMGSGSPKWEASLTFNPSYKNFDFLVQINGTYGNKIYNVIKSTAYAHKRHQDVLNAWSPANPTATVPTPVGSLSHNNIRSRSDYFLEDGSYMRVRNVQLGYNLSEKLMNKLSLSQCRVYVGVENLLTFTHYTGNDPEIGNDGLMNKGIDSGNIPVTSQYRLGLQLEF